MLCRVVSLNRVYVNSEKSNHRAEMIALFYILGGILFLLQSIAHNGQLLNAL